MPIFWYSFLVLFLVCLAVYLFLFLPKIQVNKIIISGNKKVNIEDIKSIALKNINKNIFGFLNSKSIFLAKTENIQNDILVKFPEIGSVAVSRNFPDALSVILQERSPVAIFCATNEAPSKDCYFMDESGVIFETVNNSLNNFVIIRQELNNVQVFSGQKVIEEKVLNAVLDSEKMLKDNYKIDIFDALITSPIRLNLKTSENWQIYLDLQGDINLQIAKLNLLLKDQIPENDRKTLQYIDMRFKDRAYYK